MNVKKILYRLLILNTRTRKSGTSFTVTKTEQTGDYTNAYSITLGAGIWVVTAQANFASWSGLSNRGCGVRINGGGQSYTPTTYIPETTNRVCHISVVAIIPNGNTPVNIQYQEVCTQTILSHTINVYYHAVRIG